MLIACYVGAHGEVADFFEPGSLYVFEAVAGTWVPKYQRPLDLDSGMTLAQLKEQISLAISTLTGCKVFLAKELRGVIRVFLEESGYRVWKSKGSIQAQLFDAKRQEQETVALQLAAEAALPRPESLGDGELQAFRIDLIQLRDEGSCHASRDILIPFLETEAISRLEVVCDHVPRWFPAELPDLGIEAQIPPEVPGQRMVLTLVPKEGPLSHPPGRRPGRSSCHCGG